VLVVLDIGVDSRMDRHTPAIVLSCHIF
jgi:hypothetical protein